MATGPVKIGHIGRPTPNPGSARSIVASEHVRLGNGAKNAVGTPPAIALPGRRAGNACSAKLRPRRSGTAMRLMLEGLLTLR